MKDETKKEEKLAEWTQTPFGGIVAGVLLLGVLAVFLIIYPPDEGSASKEQK